MASLRSQTLEISAASVVVVTSVAAGLVGMVIGRFSTARAERHAGVKRVVPTEPEPSGRRPAWQSVVEVEEQLRARDAELEDMRRNYELDTGLLKQEIRHLTESLAELGAGLMIPSAERHSSAARRDLPETPLGAAASRGMEFSSLEDLVGRSRREPDRP